MLLDILQKKKNHTEEYLFIQAADGAYYKHESGYYNEVGDLGVTERFDKVYIVNKNVDGTWAYRCKYGIKSASEHDFESDPVCGKKKVTVDTWDLKSWGMLAWSWASPKQLLALSSGRTRTYSKLSLTGRSRNRLSHGSNSLSRPCLSLSSEPRR